MPGCKKTHLLGADTRPLVVAPSDVARVSCSGWDPCLPTKKGRPKATQKVQCEAYRVLGASNLARLQARGADVHLLTVTVDDNADVLDVGLELAVDDAVRVADRTTGDSVLTADLTNLRHG